MSAITKWTSLHTTWQDATLEKEGSSRGYNPYEGALILVIDDDPTERLLARDALEREGYRVIEAADGPDGLAKAHTEKPEFVVLDIMMPVLDGFTVCASLRRSAMTRDLTVLIATGLGDERDVQRGFDLGANDFMVKPINWETLATRIKYIIRNVRTGQETESDAAGA